LHGLGGDPKGDGRLPRPPLPAEVEWDRFPELLSEIERVRAMLGARLRCRRGWSGDDEVPEKRAEGLGLHRVRVDGQEVIPEGALFLVTDLVGLQHLLSAQRARHHERHGRTLAPLTRV